MTPIPDPDREPPSVAPGPVTQAERIESLDVLRGFAVLGILVMNIQSFSMIGAAYVNPTAYGDLTGINYWVWLLSHIFADQKFMTIFSMLFGAGIVLMSTRRESSGVGAAGVHYRRMGILLLFGLAHAYLLWYGDILYTYALCGMLVYLFRKLAPGVLVVLGLLSISVAFLVSVGFHSSMEYWPPEQLDEMSSFWQPGPAAIAEELAIYRSGWLQQMDDRAHTALLFQTFLFATEFGWRAGGVMLLGMAFFKWGVLSSRRSSGYYVGWMLMALLIGVPVILLGVRRNFAHDWSLRECFFLSHGFNYWGSLLVAMGWVSVIALACKHGILPRLTRRLSAVGQMAFTNYLSQTIICTTLFYGHGFGLFGKLERWQQMLVVVGVWLFQLIVSPIWLRHFRFGPAEWLWRSLTYMRPQPMRRSPRADAAPEPVP